MTKTTFSCWAKERYDVCFGVQNGTTMGHCRHGDRPCRDAIYLTKKADGRDRVPDIDVLRDTRLTVEGLFWAAL